MDLLNSLSGYRNELLTFVRPYLSNQSYAWCRNTLNKIVRDSMVGTNDSLVCKEVIALRNFVIFFREHASDITPCGILMTLYMVSLQLGHKQFGDTVESFEDFKEQTDADEWKQMNIDAVNSFDNNVLLCIMDNMINGTDTEIMACGIRTLIALG